MGAQVVITCDRVGCPKRTSSSILESPAKLAELHGWTRAHEPDTWPTYTCPECANGRSAEEMLLIRGGWLMRQGFLSFDQAADCYVTPCREEAHDGDGCLVHVHSDDDPDMEGSYTQILSSGCGSYHAQVVDPEGAVLVETGDESWFEL